VRATTVDGQGTFDTAVEWFAQVPAPYLGLAAVAAVLVLALLRRGRAARPRPGEVWFALVPFEDGRAAKDRPVLVLRTRGRHVEVARFTSQDRTQRRDHLRVPDGLPGLARTSWVDLRPRTLRRRAFRRRVGVPGQGWVTWYDERRAAAGSPTV